MGVHGLWELLAPVGRRVSVETLAGKKLAIGTNISLLTSLNDFQKISCGLRFFLWVCFSIEDASIWMVQFIKAMRDDKGEIVRNAHLLGFFRRICKLLFLRTKPVFVFDGATPALKRRTLIARRRQRENAQAKVRKTAEKLLLNHVSLVSGFLRVSCFWSYVLGICLLVSSTEVNCFACVWKSFLVESKSVCFPTSEV